MLYVQHLKGKHVIKLPRIFLLPCLAISLSSFAMQPIFILSGGAVTPMGQQSQSLTYANTVFDYQPHHSSNGKPIVGGFAGFEHTFKPSWAWQFGLAFYQAGHSSINGEEAQAPLISLDAVNLWNYHYKIVSREILFENKLLFVQERYHPYVLIGLGENFNRASDFHVTAQNSGEVATAIFNSKTNQTFSYQGGFGIDVDLIKHLRMGIGYRFAYLGKYDLGKGSLDTGTDGEVFLLPPLKSRPSYSSEVLIQLTCL